MNLRNIFLYRETKVFVIFILLLLLTYLGLRFFIFDSDPIIPFINSVNESYLLLIEKFANLLLILIQSTVKIQNHIILLNGTQLRGFDTEIIFEKYAIILSLLFWITKASAWKKICFTILSAVTSFLFASIYNAVGAQLAAIHSEYISSLLLIPQNIAYLTMIAILFIWYCHNKESILKRLPINAKLLEKKPGNIIIIFCIYIIVFQFLYVYIDFSLWIEFILKSSQKILSISGYDSEVESFLLIGNNGSINVIKSCLGFKTMFLFAAVVFLTGNDNKTRSIYIISGLLFLNFVNIFRFVSLFIHLQKHGDYDLAMNFHDTFNYGMYFIVFVLWVIWFEKFTDIGSFKKELTVI